MALSSEDVDTRLSVPLTLACVGTAAESVVPRLRQLHLSDAEPAVRENAAKAIRAIDAAVGGHTDKPWWCR
jgi:hypothetical protein